MIFVPISIPLLVGKITAIVATSRLPLFTPVHGFILGRLFPKTLSRKKEHVEEIEHTESVKIPAKNKLMLALGLKLLGLKKRKGEATTIHITID